MHVNQKISEGLSLVASIDPAAQTAATYTSGWVAVANLNQFMAVISTGTMGASGTIDAKIQQAQDTSGTGAKDVTGKAIAQIVKASGDNKQALLNFRPQDLDTNNGFMAVRLSMTVGTATSPCAAYLYSVPRFEDAAGFNQAGVAQVI